MTNILNLLHNYDAALTGNALLVCLASSLAAVAVLSHARRPGVVNRMQWVVSAALVGGFGIWTTHFTAMLGYHGLGQSGYRLDLTAVSLGVVVLGLFTAFWGLVNARASRIRLACGALFGLSIVAMHYVGMAAHVGNAIVQWNINLVAISILVALALGVSTVLAIARADGLISRLMAALAMATTTLFVHFAGMAAYREVGLCGQVHTSHLLVPGNHTIGIVGSALSIVVMTYLGVFLHGRDHALRTEMRHMAELANATIEALLICDGSTIMAANETFRRLVQLDESSVSGTEIGKYLPLSRADYSSLQDGAPIECNLLDANGHTICVEVHAHRVIYAGKPHMAYAILDIRKRKESEDAIKRLANEDHLTQLPNRYAFYSILRDCMDRATAESTCLALVCIDLDHFKQINDHYGHRVGDQFLQRAAGVMGGLLACDQVLGRVGGDEFALILPDIACAERALQVAEAILEAFAHDNTAVGSSVKLSASLGVAVFPEHAQSKMDLLAAADSAMYKAKREGRNRARLYDTVMALDARKHRQLASELQASIKARDFELVYQPQINCATGRIIGREALLRWSSPTYGAVEPTKFIAIAEECGEICKIGEWVLEQACRDAAAWVNGLSVAVNVSSVQLIDQDFPLRVHEALLQAGLSPRRLELEITETALVHDFDRALQVLRKIKSMGIRIAMDDFGTGYSSLSNLRSFPFDKIKIDKSFIRDVHCDEQSSAIVRAAIGLANGLGLRILAEGVETSNEYEYLKNAGCDEMQGFYLGRPELNGAGITKRELFLGKAAG